MTTVIKIKNNRQWFYNLDEGFWFMSSFPLHTSERFTVTSKDVEKSAQELIDEVNI